jgi:hypothetical protein
VPAGLRSRRNIRPFEWSDRGEHSFRSQTFDQRAGQRQILTPKHILKTSVGFASPYEFPIWKAVDLGALHDANAVRDAFRKVPELIHVDSWADQMLDRVIFRQAGIRLNLVLATVSELGFGEDGASLKDIYERASQLGLTFCTAELGPALRLAYLGQPLGEYLRIAMQPVARSDGQGHRLYRWKGPLRTDVVRRRR